VRLILLTVAICGCLAAKKALRHGNPFHSGTYRCLASAFAHLGRDAEAREAAARVLEFDPAFTISAWIARGWTIKLAADD
jgi:adenylate cyclase